MLMPNIYSGQRGLGISERRGCPNERSKFVVGVTRARYSCHVVAAAEKAAGPAYRILEKAGLAESIFENPNSMTTIWQLGQVMRASALWTDNLDIGWDAAEAASLEQYGAFSERLFLRSALHERLLAFCRQAREEYSEANFSVRSHGRKIFFVRASIAGEDIEARQTELYVLSMMLGTIRSVLGQHWQPEQVSMQTFHRPDTERHFDTMSTDLRFGQRETVIVIDDIDLARSVERMLETDVDTRSYETSPDLIWILGSLIRLYLGDSRLGLNFMAKICDLHPRTLQRLLREKNITFKELVAHQRFISASNVLKETDLPIAEVSSMLGYSHHAHFTRAFREYAGLTPTAYRQACQE